MESRVGDGMVTDKELDKWIKFARKRGLKSLKCAHFEFELSDRPAPVRAPRGKSVSEPTERGNATPTDEEFLYWSSGYDPSENKNESELDGAAQ